MSSEPDTRVIKQEQESTIPTSPKTPRECLIYLDPKHPDLFPLTREATNCVYFSAACLLCLQKHLKIQMKSKKWKEGSLTCPVYNRSLSRQEIEEYADGETLAM